MNTRQSSPIIMSTKRSSGLTTITEKSGTTLFTKSCLEANRTEAYRMLGKEHVGVEPAVRSPRRQHRPLVADGRVVHDAYSPRRRAADDLVGLGVPHHATHAGIRRCVHLCDKKRRVFGCKKTTRRREFSIGEQREGMRCRCSSMSIIKKPRHVF